jgi:signal transduction histidine kinase
VKSAKGKQKQDRVSLIVHEINNMICGLRMQANNLSAKPHLSEPADDIRSASDQIEVLVKQLASLARIPT